MIDSQSSIADTTLPTDTENALADCFRPVRFALLLGLLVVVSWPAVVFGTQSFVLRDFSVFGYPIAHYARESFWNGEIPLWNPLNNCGLPFLAQWNTMVLYPPSLIYLLLPLPWSLCLFCLLHLYGGGLGMYFLARRWTANNFAAAIAGVAYAFNGLTQTALMWPNNIAALGCLPWVVLCAQLGWREGGKWFTRAALVGALQMLTGAPEIILLTWVFIGVLWLADLVAGKEHAVRSARGCTFAPGIPIAPSLSGNPDAPSFHPSPPVGERVPEAPGQGTRPTICRPGALTGLPSFREVYGESSRGLEKEDSGRGEGLFSVIVRLPLLVVVIAGLSAAQLLPFLDLLAHSQRGEEFGGQVWSASQFAWVNFLVPLFRTIRASSGVYLQADQLWALSFYAGVGTLLLSVMAGWRLHRSGLLVLIALGSLGLAMGAAGVLFPIADRFAPLGFMRYPAKFMVLTAIVIPLLAAVGLKRFLDSKDGESSNSFSFAVMALLGLFGTGFWLIGLVPVDGEMMDPVYQSASVRLAFLLCVVGLLFGLKKVTEARRRSLIAFALIAVVWFDLKTHLPNLTATVSPALMVDRLPLLQDLKPRPALENGRAMLTANALLEFKHKSLPDMGQTLVLQRVGMFDNFNLLEGLAKMDGIWSLYLREQFEIEMRLYASETNIQPALGDFLAVNQVSSPTNIFQWIPRPTAMPVITAGQQPVFVQFSNIFRVLLARNFDPREVVYFNEDSTELMSTNRVRDARIRQSSISAHRVAFDIETPTPTVAVIAQSYHRGWEATVNEQPARVYRVNHGFQAVRIPAGRHHVELRYRDRKFMAGSFISLGTLFALFGFKRIEKLVIKSGNKGKNAETP